MTVFETWITETVANLVRDMREQTRPGSLAVLHDQRWDELERRAAVILVQARALECRHLAAELQINNAIERRAAVILVQARALECRHLAAELQINNASNPAARQVAGRLLDRSSKLEAIGMMLARGPWPIPDKDAPKIQVVTH